MAYKCLFLDIDNTLLDFTGAAHLALTNALGQHNIELTPELHSLYTSANHASWSEFEQGHITAVELRSLRFKRFFLSASISDINPAYFNALFIQKLIDHSTSYSEIIPLLEKLSQRYVLCVVTNGLKEAQRARLEKLNMTRLFETITVSDEIGIAKPDPRIFYTTIESLQSRFKKSEILMVGDSLQSDILGGNRAGLDTCWISHSRENTTAIYPKYTITEFAEIEGVLA